MQNEYVGRKQYYYSSQQCWPCACVSAAAAASPRHTFDVLPRPGSGPACCSAPPCPCPRPAAGVQLPPGGRRLAASAARRRLPEPLALWPANYAQLPDEQVGERRRGDARATGPSPAPPPYQCQLAQSHSPEHPAQLPAADPAPYLATPEVVGSQPASAAQFAASSAGQHDTAAPLIQEDDQDRSGQP